MKVFHVRFFWHGSYGAFKEVDFVVIAETSDKAIGMAAQSRPDLTNDLAYWSVEELSTENNAVFHINESCS